MMPESVKSVKVSELAAGKGICVEGDDILVGAQ
jgi:hypothetical protein